MADLSRREFLEKTATDAVVTGLLASGVAQLRANPLGLPIGRKRRGVEGHECLKKGARHETA